MKATSRLWRPRRTVVAEIAPRRDTHITNEQSPQRIGITPQMPGSMPRAEDDAATRDESTEFHDRPGSGKNTSTRHFYF